MLFTALELVLCFNINVIILVAHNNFTSFGSALLI